MKALLESLFHRRTLAVIGTAGRRDDGDKLTLEHWNRMILATLEVIEKEGITDVVSGGAAWADHCAVCCGMPARIIFPDSPQDLRTAAYYHGSFSRVVGRDTMREAFAAPHEFHGSFKDRNSQVAAAADVYLAMTFGEGEKVKDGGTADTVRKMRRRGVTGYHFNLNDLTIY